MAYILCKRQKSATSTQQILWIVPASRLNPRHKNKERLQNRFAAKERRVTHSNTVNCRMHSPPQIISTSEILSMNTGSKLSVSSSESLSAHWTFICQWYYKACTQSCTLSKWQMATWSIMLIYLQVSSSHDYNMFCYSDEQVYLGCYINKILVILTFSLLQMFVFILSNHGSSDWALYSIHRVDYSYSAFST